MAIAAAPEGLATIVTSALALGGQRMVRRGAIVRRLLAIEGLGSTSVICSDKTGTLTTGRVAVASAVPAHDEAALWEVAEQLMAEGLRVLAVASATTDRLDADGLQAGGLLAFRDPLRPSTKAVVEDCRHAGIRIVLVTGDHLVTAQAVAADAGLPPEPAVTGAELRDLAPENRRHRLGEAAVVARVEPEVKVELVEAHRSAGEIVAVTGDGVNDAPALRRADVGVALAGRGGTDVAREVASVVVTDDDIATVVEAVREGRRIHRNLLSVVSYLVTGNLSEVLVVMGLILIAPSCSFLSCRYSCSG